MTKNSDELILIDGLEYCNWNRELLENLWNGGITVTKKVKPKITPSICGIVLAIPKLKPE